MTSDQLAAMSVEDLIRFADQYLSLPIPFGMPRTAILTKIVGAALAARDIT